MNDIAHQVPIAVIGADPDTGRSLFVHGTGFCKETLLPLVDELNSIGGDVGAMLMDMRGHGKSTPHPGPFDWDSVARDVVEVAQRSSVPLVGVGHSSGGAAMARAEILEPGTFSQLILIEPIVFPGPYAPKDIPVSVAAGKRRRSFASRDAAFARFHAGPFRKWDDRALHMYVDHGFGESVDGWTLLCEPAIEAEFYRQAFNIDTWDRLHEIGCPVTVISGEYSTTHVDPYLTSLLDQFRDPERVVLVGLGHLAPMEDPRVVAGKIEEAMARF